ncbi:MAG: DNRLRE domain-containing protein, partial [Thermodesulfobacteriota bacterium]|nr:DNRLRE domain-containing protein [Thermodesulfobacteriota bacterium]
MMTPEFNMRLSFFISAMFLTALHSAGAGTITKTSEKDTYIDQLLPDDNFGQDWKILFSGEAGDARGLFHFDLSGLDHTALIEDARLTFHIHSNPSTSTYLLNPLSSSWKEDSVTWNQVETGTSWKTPGGDFDPDTFLAFDLPGPVPGWMVADVTPLISDQGGNLNTDIAENGFLVRADTGFSKILSSEFSTYGNATTCHSCHGAWPPELDDGKSLNCSSCHAQGEVFLAGEPSLILDYQQMLFQFVQVSDTHIGKNPPQQAENLYHAVEQINEINAAFVLFTGDLTDSGTLEQYATFKDALSGLDMPCYCVPGDNDIIDGEGDLKRYREQLGDDYYAFDYHAFNFIGLNNNCYLSLDEDQRLWVEKEVMEGKSQIIFVHRPLLDSANGEPIPGPEDLLGLFESHHVTMYMNGHEHITAQHTLSGTHHIWCDNLSWFHSGAETFNLYRIYSDRIVLFHVNYDGSKVFAGSLPLSIKPDIVVTKKAEEWIDPTDPSKGYKIHYTIENHGTEIADESTTCLFIDDIHAGNHSCPALKPYPHDPHSYSGTFEGPFYCVGQSDLIKICTDYGMGCDGFGTVEQGNENNNCMQNE